MGDHGRYEMEEEADRREAAETKVKARMRKHGIKPDTVGDYERVVRECVSTIKYLRHYKKKIENIPQEYRKWVPGLSEAEKLLEEI